MGRHIFLYYQYTSPPMRKTLCITITLLFIIGTLNALKYQKNEAELSGSLKFYKRFLKNRAENQLGHTIDNFHVPKHIINKPKKHKLHLPHISTSAVVSTVKRVSHATRGHDYVKTPVNFPERQDMRKTIYDINHDIHETKRSNTRENIEQEKHVLKLKTAQKNYVEDARSQGHQNGEREQALKYQINHDEKFKEAFEKRANKNAIKAQESDDKDTKVRFLQSERFDKSRVNYYQEKENQHYDSLRNLGNEDQNRDDKVEHTEHRLKEGVYKAELEAYKIRTKGEHNAKKLERKEEAHVESLSKGEALKYTRRNRNKHLKKIKHEIIEVGESA